MGILDWALLIVFIGSLIWGADRHLCLKDVEIDLKEYLGDLLVSRDSSVGEACKCCRQNTIYSVKSLIRKHFKL
jgi:hypothetical protein